MTGNRRNQRLMAVFSCAGMLALGADHARAEKQLLWGDTHLHSSYSFDAYLNRNLSADPDTAYRYAKGLPVIHPFHRARVQIETPLDFLVVADHAEYLGVIRHINTEGIPRDDMGWLERIYAALAERQIRQVIADDEGLAFFSSLLPKPQSVESAAANPPASAIPGAATMQRSAWQESIRITDSHYEPGKFTSLIGWEWSSIPAGANLHRVVFTSADSEAAGQFQPFSSSDSSYPEDLWAWLEETSERTGVPFVAIPHNSNISKGYMFPETQSLKGTPITADFAKTRLVWEPVVEITQIKGDSETHPVVSPDDPFADFETYTHYIQQQAPPYDPGPGDYVRSALRRGLEIEGKVGVNPYAFGVIGSTDAHTGLSSAEEANFWGKFPRDSIPEAKTDSWRPDGGPNGWSMSASGLAAVWAEENTRESIFAAFKRKEVYGTTGPRIAVRVFGGWDFAAADAEAADLAAVGYAGGVPMGGDLSVAPRGRSPRFLVHVAKDAKGANLDRAQMIKGWRDSSGASYEKVFEIAWSGERAPGADGQLPPVGNSVDLAAGTHSNEIGAPEFATVWEDPEFDPNQSAFYYVRVLQIPTPRHSLWDALALGLDPSELPGPATIQERAYTSPIWYKPTE